MEVVYVIVHARACSLSTAQSPSQPGIRAPSAIPATSSATRACSAPVYTTTSGQALGGASEPTVAQAVKKIIAITRATRGGVEHLAVNGMCAPQFIKAFGGAACALGRATEVEEEQGEGERGEDDSRPPPRPWPGEKRPEETRSHQRRPFFQSSTRAQTATAIPASASAMKSQRSVSR